MRILRMLPHLLKCKFRFSRDRFRKVFIDVYWKYHIGSYSMILSWLMTVHSPRRLAEATSVLTRKSRFNNAQTCANHLMDLSQKYTEIIKNQGSLENQARQCMQVDYGISSKMTVY